MATFTSTSLMKESSRLPQSESVEIDGVQPFPPTTDDVDPPDPTSLDDLFPCGSCSLRSAVSRSSNQTDVNMDVDVNMDRDVDVDVAFGSDVDVDEDRDRDRDGDHHHTTARKHDPTSHASDHHHHHHHHHPHLSQEGDPPLSVSLLSGSPDLPVWCAWALGNEGANLWHHVAVALANDAASASKSAQDVEVEVEEEEEEEAAARFGSNGYGYVAPSAGPFPVVAWSFAGVTYDAGPTEEIPLPLPLPGPGPGPGPVVSDVVDRRTATTTSSISVVDLTICRWFVVVVVAVQIALLRALGGVREVWEDLARLLGRRRRRRRRRLSSGRGYVDTLMSMTPNTFMMSIWQRLVEWSHSEVARPEHWRRQWINLIYGAVPELYIYAHDPSPSPGCVTPTYQNQNHDQDQNQNQDQDQDHPTLQGMRDPKRQHVRVRRRDSDGIWRVMQARRALGADVRHVRREGPPSVLRRSTGEEGEGEREREGEGKETVEVDAMRRVLADGRRAVLAKRVPMGHVKKVTRITVSADGAWVRETTIRGKGRVDRMEGQLRDPGRDVGRAHGRGFAPSGAE